MKTFGLVLLFVFSAQVAQCEQVLLMKTGERMKGQLKAVAGDVISFVYKGNQLSIKTNEVTAVYFDEKAAQSAGASNPETKLKGVVTYFFNDNYGDKPDSGAEVYITRHNEGFDYRKVTLYKRAMSQKENLAEVEQLLEKCKHLDRKPKQSDIDAATKYAETIRSSLRDMKALTDDDFKSIDNSAADEILKLKTDPKTIKLAVDGNGAFSQRMEPGEYDIIIISKHRSKNTKAEILGTINYQNLTQKSGEELNLSANFAIK